MKNEKTALVLQGGALRTVFTSGVLDAFLSQKFFPFDIYIGVSAGTMCLSYYLGNQYKTTFEIIQKLAEDKEFINIFNAFKEEGIVNLSHLKQFTTNKYPIDYKTLEVNKKGKTIEFVATDIETGNPEYLTPTMKNWNECLIASSTLPIYSKGKHELLGKKLMDGGWSDPIPVKRALELGATKIIVIRTTPLNYRDKKSYIGMVSSVWYRDQIALKKCLLEEHQYFNSAVDFMEENHEGVEIFQIAPETTLKSSAASSSKTKVLADYRDGLDEGLQFLMKNKDKFI